MIYEGYKVYGPYTRKDGRKHVCLVRYENGEKVTKTVSYPKYLVEVSLERYLINDETVDHLDRDFTNDDLANLVVRNRSEHAAIDAKRLKEKDFICEHCGVSFTLAGQRLHGAVVNRSRLKKGPFCSRSCAGKASHNIEAYTVKEIKPEYFYVDK